MRVCCFCGEEIFNFTSENDGYCFCCEDETFAIESSEINIADIEREFYYFKDLDLLTQIELIKDSIGCHEEKLNKLKICIENEYWRLCKDE